MKVLLLTFLLFNSVLSLSKNVVFRTNIGSYSANEFTGAIGFSIHSCQVREKKCIFISMKTFRDQSFCLLKSACVGFNWYGERRGCKLVDAKRLIARSLSLHPMFVEKVKEFDEEGEEKSVHKIGPG